MTKDLTATITARRTISTKLPLPGFGLEGFRFLAQGFGLGLAIGFVVALREVFHGLNRPFMPRREVLSFEAQ